MTSESWHEMALGEFVTLQRGHDLPERVREPGTVPVLGSFGITGYHSQAMAKGPGVTVGRSGASFGVVSYSEQDFWPLNTALYVIDFHGNHPRFAYYFLKSIDFSRFNSGSAQPSLNRNYIHPIRITVPPFDEQTAIAELLGALDDKIDLNKRINETLEATARAVFDSRLNRVDSSLQRTACLEEVLAELETGSRPPGGVAGYSEGVPSVGAENILGLGKYDFGKTKYVPSSFYDQMPRGKVKNKDVLLYKDGGKPGQYEPHVTLFGDGFPFSKLCINEHVYRLRCNDSYSQSLLYLWLTGETASEEMRRKGTGVAIPGLNSSAVRSLTVVIPPRSAVAECDAIVSPLIEMVLNNSSENVMLGEIRDSVLPKLLSGEVRIKQAEKVVEDKA